MVHSGLSAEQQARFRREFAEYSRGSHYRSNALWMRNRAHDHLRRLLAADQLDALSLDDFDRHVWQLGSLAVRGESFDWHHADQFLAETPPDRMAAMAQAGDVRFSGNVTWGSAARTLRAYARGRSDAQMQSAMRQALRTLLHSSGSIEHRLHQVSQLKIGFGRNICSGLLMVWQPRQSILYNAVSEQFWAGFGWDVSAGSDWVEPYLHYNAFCKRLFDDLASDLSLQSLVELDVFFYWHTSVRSRPDSQPPVKPPTRRPSRPAEAGGGPSLAQLRATRQEMPPERFRAVWGDVYDRLLAEDRAKMTTAIAQDELGLRAGRKVGEIQAFLRGQSEERPSSEALCHWIDFCYELELYRETVSLLQYVLEDEVDPAFYRRAKRLAEAGKVKLGW